MPTLSGGPVNTGTVAGEPEVTERWADSAEHDALFVPDGYAFAQSLSNAQTLRVSYRPHNAPKAVATFQVAGIAEALQPAAKQCGIKKEAEGRRYLLPPSLLC